jgi:hypothetical protein
MQGFSFHEFGRMAESFLYYYILAELSRVSFSMNWGIDIKCTVYLGTLHDYSTHLPAARGAGFRLPCFLWK